jgi:hypothetical protein
MRAAVAAGVDGCSVGVLLEVAVARTTASTPYPSVHAHFVGEILASEDDELFGADGLGDGAARFGEIDGHHPAAIGGEQIGDEQADEALADDEHAVAEARFELADGLEGDGGDGGVGGLPVVDAVGDFGGEQIGNGDEFGVEGAFGTAAGDAVADAEPGVGGIDRLDDARGAVAERGWGFRGGCGPLSMAAFQPRLRAVSSTLRT